MVSSRHPSHVTPVLPSPQVRRVLFHHSARLRPQGFIPGSDSNFSFARISSNSVITSLRLSSHFNTPRHVSARRDTLQLFSKNANRRMLGGRKRKSSRAEERDV